MQQPRIKFVYVLEGPQQIGIIKNFGPFFFLGGGLGHSSLIL